MSDSLQKNGINIIQGKNESGKSTLLNYIISSFYGISKNKKGKEMSDIERYTPWTGEEFSGKLEYELDNQEKFEVFREFKKKNPKITFKLCSGMAFYLNLDKKIVQYYQNKEGKDEYTVSDMWSGLAYSAAYSI